MYHDVEENKTDEEERYTQNLNKVYLNAIS
jgi:hypothetical protein